MSANEEILLSAKDLKHPFFEGFSDNHLEVLASCAMRIEFAEGEYVFKHGELANRFYCLLSGRVDLLAADGLVEPVVIQSLGGGDVLGWSWICPPYEWSFDARAMASTQAIFLYATRLRETCEENPSLGYELMKRMTPIMMERLQASRRALLRSGRGALPEEG